MLWLSNSRGTFTQPTGSTSKRGTDGSNITTLFAVEILLLQAFVIVSLTINSPFTSEQLPEV